MADLNFLNAGEPAPEVVPAIDPAPEPVVAPLADTVAEPVTPEQQPAPVAEKPTVPEGYIPLAAVLDTRDQLKAEKEARRRLEEQLQQYQQPAPSPDDEGYVDWQAQQTQNAILSTRLDISEDMAREKFGDTTVDQAKDWAVKRFAESPAFQQEVLSQRNPYGYAVAQYQKQQSFEKLGNDGSEIEAFLAWKAAQGATTTQPAVADPAAATPEQPAMPPRSIASAPSAGGGVAHVPQGPGIAYAGLFGQGN